MYKTLLIMLLILNINTYADQHNQAIAEAIDMKLVTTGGTKDRVTDASAGVLLNITPIPIVEAIDKPPSNTIVDQNQTTIVNKQFTTIIN